MEDGGTVSILPPTILGFVFPDGASRTALRSPTAADPRPDRHDRPPVRLRAAVRDESGRRTDPPDGPRVRPRPADRPITAATAAGPRSIRTGSAS